MRFRERDWVRVGWPNRLVHPFTFTARSGREFTKFIVNVPYGAKVDGVDVGGFSFSVWPSRRGLEDKLNGRRSVSIGFRPDASVELFRGRGHDRETAVVGPLALRDAVRGGSGSRSVVPPRSEVRGSLVDAAPPADAPLGEGSSQLFDRCAMDTGFVARMDAIADEAAQSLVGGRYDAFAVLAEVGVVVDEMSAACASAFGEAYDAATCARTANYALSALTEVINHHAACLADAGVGRPDVIAASKRERAEHRNGFLAERAAIDALPKAEKETLPGYVLGRAFESTMPCTVQAHLRAWASVQACGGPSTGLIPDCAAMTVLDPADPLSMVDQSFSSGVTM